MEVTVNGTAVTPFLFFTFSGQLAGVLPSNTPVGQGTLTVTFNGETSEPVTIEVVKSAFGMFTRNWWPGFSNPRRKSRSDKGGIVNDVAAFNCHQDIRALSQAPA